jgi:tripartite-type tricarboxylate transporter receptor subunit TctC
MGLVANATPDGTTLGFGASGDLMITQYVVQHISYDPLKALVPVALVADTPQVLSIAGQVPAHNVQEFIAYAKANAGKVNYGSSGIGSTTHLGAFLFGSLNGLQLTHVLYRSSTLVTLDMIAGRIQMQHSSPLAVLEQARLGKIRMLVVARSERSTLLPDVPSAPEVGLPGYVTPVWFGMFAPRATPKPIVDKLNALMRDMVRDPQYKELMTKSLFGGVSLTPEEIQARVQQEAPMWAKIVHEANITAK